MTKKEKLEKAVKLTMNIKKLLSEEIESIANSFKDQHGVDLQDFIDHCSDLYPSILDALDTDFDEVELNHLILIFSDEFTKKILQKLSNSSEFVNISLSSAIAYKIDEFMRMVDRDTPDDNNPDDPKNKPN